LNLPTNPHVCIVFLCSSHLQPVSFIDLSMSIGIRARLIAGARSIDGGHTCGALADS
jgi:hypothetical protein